MRAGSCWGMWRKSRVRRLVDALLEAGFNWRVGWELAESARLSKCSVGSYLRVLVKHGLVEKTKVNHHCAALNRLTAYRLKPVLPLGALLSADFLIHVLRFNHNVGEVS